MNSGAAAQDRRREFAQFAQTYIAPAAAAADQAGKLDPNVIDELRNAGFLGGSVPRDSGGLGMDPVTYGALTAEIGRACSAARTLLTVHSLVEMALLRWGSTQLKSEWLPELAAGRRLAAFALSESHSGSDAGALNTEIRSEGNDLVIHGQKSWISFGQTADLFLVFGRAPEGITAVLIPGDCDGLLRQPVTTMVGTRGAMMAHLTLDHCRIPSSAIVGRAGFGLSHVGATALDHGRYSVAWGAVGIIDAAWRACMDFARQRSQFSTRLKDQPLMRARLTRLAVAARAARLLCMEAGRLRGTGSNTATVQTLIAKYFSSKAAVYAANEAIQIHGARGLLEETGLERLLRDAKVTEIIEGSSDLIELMLHDVGLEVDFD